MKGSPPYRLHLLDRTLLADTQYESNLLVCRWNSRTSMYKCFRPELACQLCIIQLDIMCSTKVVSAETITVVLSLYIITMVTPDAATYGFHPRSEGLAKRMPARETVAGVAALRCPISNISLMEGVRGTRSLLASVRT